MEGRRSCPGLHPLLAAPSERRCARRCTVPTPARTLCSWAHLLCGCVVGGQAAVVWQLRDAHPTQCLESLAGQTSSLPPQLCRLLCVCSRRLNRSNYPQLMLAESHVDHLRAVYELRNLEPAVRHPLEARPESNPRRGESSTPIQPFEPLCENAQSRYACVLTVSQWNCPDPSMSSHHFRSLAIGRIWSPPESEYLYIVQVPSHREPWTSFKPLPTAFHYRLFVPTSMYTPADNTACSAVLLECLARLSRLRSRESGAWFYHVPACRRARLRP